MPFMWKRRAPTFAERRRGNPIAFMGHRYLALLRGINVGGRNLIARDALRRCFEDLGFGNVRTYIQSGNVLFRARERRIAALASVIEQALSKRFAYEARIAVLSASKYTAALRGVPESWCKTPGCLHNALFPLAGVTPREVLAGLPAPKAGMETAAAASGVIFWSAPQKCFHQTAMAKIAAVPVYRQVTVRNHNTVFQLAALLEEI